MTHILLYWPASEEKLDWNTEEACAWNKAYRKLNRKLKESREVWEAEKYWKKLKIETNGSWKLNIRIYKQKYESVYNTAVKL